MCFSEKSGKITKRVGPLNSVFYFFPAFLASLGASFLGAAGLPPSFLSLWALATTVLLSCTGKNMPIKTTEKRLLFSSKA